MHAWEYFTNQKQWESYLKDLLRLNDNALLKSIVLIYDSQTNEEKSKRKSVEDNLVGFSKVDAYEMSRIAQKIKAGKELTPKEMTKSRNKMQKYWKQLMNISKANMTKTQEHSRKLHKLQVGEANEGLKRFKEHNEILRRCSEEGIPCSYGICDECPLTTGLQTKLNFNYTRA